MSLEADLLAAAARVQTDSRLLHEIVHGDAASTVATEGGSIKTVAKTIEDMEAGASAVATTEALRKASVYDIPFRAGYDADQLSEDLEVKTYAVMLAGRAFSITGLMAAIATAPTGAALILDLEIDDVTAFTTKPEFADGATALTEGVLTAQPLAVAAGAKLALKVTQIGSTEPGEGLLVSVLGDSR